MFGRGFESVGPKGADLGELYRRRMAQMLMQQGMSGAPLGSGNPIEGIARALTAGVGGHMARRADEREGERSSAIAAELSQAFQPTTAPDPTVAGPRVGTGTTTQPDQSSIVKALMGSQYEELQNRGLDMYQNQMQDSQKQQIVPAGATLMQGGKPLFTAPTKPDMNLPEGMMMGPDGSPVEIPGYADMRARIAAAGRSETAPKNVQTVTTAEGVFVLNPDGTRGIKLGDAPRTNSQAGLSPTSQKELFEADDIVVAASNAANALDVALGLNERAASGMGAKGEQLLNRVFDKDAAAATSEFNQIVTGQVLDSLKATFGAAPTEGERKILLDMQAAPNMTRAERSALLARAKAAVQRRALELGNKAKALREGTYFSADGYKPGEASATIAESAKSGTTPPNNAFAGWSIQKVN